jgi:hypothetical protein
MAEFKRVGVGWLTKDRKGIRGVINEAIPENAKFLLSKNKFKTDSEADQKKPDYTLTLIIEQQEEAGF